jgi:hypothetical protein
MTRRSVLGAAAGTAMAAQMAAAAPAESDREYWIRTLRKVGDPVLNALSQRRLKAEMPVEAHANVTDRRNYTYLEALGRLLAGMAPWLESNESGDSRRYADLARKSIAAAVDPASPDLMNFSHGGQPVVDAAFLALGVLRAPTELWDKLDAATKANLVQSMLATRAIQPGFNNWLLFSAMVEAFLSHAGEKFDPMRVDYAVRQHDEWYKGDGMYGDGPQFHWDYYNSYVIQPMLLQVLDTISKVSKSWNSFTAPVLKRARRFAAIQERIVAPDGSFPAIGRSLAYRCGAFHHLATMALRKDLPAGVSPEQVRGALTAVIRRTLDAVGTFDEKGWLRIGLCGHQPSIGETYISTGSLYLCAEAFLPLGLPASDPFWSGAAKPWTAQQAWSGAAVAIDHAGCGVVWGQTLGSVP